VSGRQPDAPGLRANGGAARAVPAGKPRAPDTILDAALRLAKSGLPVFPCHQNKRPASPHGFRDASRDPDAIVALWHAFPGPLIGMPTGEASGRDILDIDPRHGGEEWEAQHRDRLPTTLVHETKSGGRHYVFAHASGVRNSAGLIAPGVDVRGDGGYAIVPPSPGYTVAIGTEPAPLPEWLLPLVLKPNEPIARPVPATPPQPISSARVQGYIAKQLDKLRSAPEGGKHHALRDAAITLGGVVERAGISDQDAITQLLAALPDTVKDWSLAARTAQWGLTTGRTKPLDLEDRPNPRAKTNGAAHSASQPETLHDPEPPERGNGHDPAASSPEPAAGDRAYPLLDATDFMATFTNPDYLLDGIIQRGRVHALTSMTGHGKTALALYLACSIAKGWDIGNLEVVQGEVIFLAGENPDDLCGRFFAACQHYGIHPASLRIRVMPGNFPMDADTAEMLKQQIAATERPPALIIADSAAAYFPGDDENQNVQMGAFARNLRVLTRCRGNPAVLILCHPVKNAGRENLIPRGGGAFLNEIDVNLTLWADAQDTITLHWQGKIRGADFQPVNFCLKQVKIAEKTDAKGRPFVSIVATLQTEDQADKTVAQATTDENTVLEWLRRTPGITIGNICQNAGWVSEGGVPNKAKVYRLLKSLDRNKLVKNWRGKWEITEAGKAELPGEKARVC
jgi:Bifunctional DNA primase/polymerase, N-terminal/AAA domain